MQSYAYSTALVRYMFYKLSISPRSTVFVEVKNNSKRTSYDTIAYVLVSKRNRIRVQDRTSFYFQFYGMACLYRLNNKL
jgi:hypothetical protein